jgi:hypothetical protein
MPSAEISATFSLSPASDFTGYRYSSATRIFIIIIILDRVLATAPGGGAAPGPEPDTLLARWAHVLGQETTHVLGDECSVFFQGEVPRIEKMHLDGL